MNKEGLISKIDLAIILSLITGAAYCMSYIYKFGEFKYYNIPLFFIDIGTRDVFFTMFILFPLFLGIIWNIYTNTDYVQNKITESTRRKYENIAEKEQEFKSSVNNIKEKLKENLIGEDVDVHFQQLEKEFIEIEKFMNREKIKSQLHFVFLIFALIALVIVTIGSIYFLFKSGSSLFAYLMIMLAIVTFLLNFLMRKKRYGYASLVISIFFLCAPYVSGYNSASGKEKHITFEEEQEVYVVLAIYKEQFLFAPLDKDNQKYKDTFYIKDIKDVKYFKHENIGELTKEK